MTLNHQFILPHRILYTQHLATVSTYYRQQTKVIYVPNKICSYMFKIKETVLQLKFDPTWLKSLTGQFDHASAASRHGLDTEGWLWYMLTTEGDSDVVNAHILRCVFTVIRSVSIVDDLWLKDGSLRILDEHVNRSVAGLTCVDLELRRERRLDAMGLHTVPSDLDLAGIISWVHVDVVWAESKQTFLAGLNTFRVRLLSVCSWFLVTLWIQFNRVDLLG